MKPSIVQRSCSEYSVALKKFCFYLLLLGSFIIFKLPLHPRLFLSTQASSSFIQLLWSNLLFFKRLTQNFSMRLSGVSFFFAKYAKKTHSSNFASKSSTWLLKDSIFEFSDLYFNLQEI